MKSSIMIYLTLLSFPLRSTSSFSRQIRVITATSAAFQTNSRSVTTTTTSSSISSSSSSSSPSSSYGEKTLSSLPPSHPYISEIKPALSAIRKACRISSYLQPTTANQSISGINKQDASPVTIGDFAVQALVLKMLENEFKHDIFVAEECSKNLVTSKPKGGKQNGDGGEDLSNEILIVMKQCGFDHLINSVDELKRSIDLGQTYEEDGKIKEELIIDSKNHNGGILRTWCLDPIDGTRGFLRGKREGGQYCIALALIEVR